MLEKINSMQEAIEKIQNCVDQKSFDSVKLQLQDYMKKIGMGKNDLQELEKRAFYFVNEYSERDTRQNIKEAKKRVTKYICELMTESSPNDLLLAVLENFYFFLENLLEREPNKRGGIQKEYLNAIRIKNEYDIQFLLYAYLKPIYPEARTEVSEDTGYNTVRTDIYVKSDKIIEIKCSRKSMQVKKLLEEIEADIIHYSASNIYFFIYDKEKIIKEPLSLKNHFEKKITEKKIHIIIHQPKRL